MKPDSILEEIWHIKDELGARHGFDVRKICEELKVNEARWKGANPLVRSPSELQRLANAGESATALNDKPPRKP